MEFSPISPEDLALAFTEKELEELRAKIAADPRTFEIISPNIPIGNDSTITQSIILESNPIHPPLEKSFTSRLTPTQTPPEFRK